jgi:pimeloyl-ACP methyl ester carboxylesterase
LLLGVGGVHAAPYRLEPFKDDLFAYKTILKTEYGGDFLVVDYDRKRDLYERDVVERQKVRPEYVDLATEAVESDGSIKVGGRKVEYTAVGKTDGGASAIVVFIHGRGTDRSAGASDWIHGGNFNRVKNLMMRNGGVYISADFSDFGRRGTAEMKALLLDQAGRSPGAPVFLACGSWGGKICWRLIADGEAGALVKGVLFLDSEMSTDFIATAAKLPPERRPAINISNTMEDWIVGYKSQVAFFQRMKKEVPDYPIRFVLFDSGTHGISLRMTDWREVLNWMFEVQGG